MFDWSGIRQITTFYIEGSIPLKMHYPLQKWTLRRPAVSILRHLFYDCSALYYDLWMLVRLLTLY